jgi:phage shock protein PspC (stress-responsive transcriptional regulator)
MFRRSKTNKYVGGVCGGLEKSSNIPAIIFRLVALFVPGVWFIYLFMWAIVKQED